MNAAANSMVTAAVIEQFKQITGKDHVLPDHKSLNNYGHDETKHLLFPPQVVFRPRTAEEINAAMKICNRHRIPGYTTWRRYRS